MQIGAIQYIHKSVLNNHVKCKTTKSAIGCRVLGPYKVQKVNSTQNSQAVIKW